MKVQKDMTVGLLKSIFAKYYPYLHLSVYSKPHYHFEGSEKKNEVGDSIILSSLNPKMNDGEIKIHDQLTVDELESTFADQYGLSVQVLRKSGNQWLQTSATDSWTLVKQNQKAAEYHEYMNKDD